MRRTARLVRIWAVRTVAVDPVVKQIAASMHAVVAKLIEVAHRSQLQQLFFVLTFEDRFLRRTCRDRGAPRHRRGVRGWLPLVRHRRGAFLDLSSSRTPEGHADILGTSRMLLVR